MTQEDMIKIQRLMMLIAPMGFSLVTSRENPEGEIIVTIKAASTATEKKSETPPVTVGE